MSTKRAPETRGGRTRGTAPWLVRVAPERESMDAAVRTSEAHTLREIAELQPASPRGHRMAPSALRVRPCKGPSILYCAGHRELFDIWIFWDPANFGEVREDAISRLETYLRWFEPDRGPNGAARDARLVELVAAFLGRHEGCRIRACADTSSEYAEVIGSGEEAWTVFCLSEDDPLWERVSLARVERCRREVERFKRDRLDHPQSWEERVRWKKDREMWTRHLREQEKTLRTTGRLWTDHVPFGDVLEQLRSVPIERPLVTLVP